MREPTFTAGVARGVLEYNLGAEHIISRRKALGLSVSPPSESIIENMKKKRKLNKAKSNSHSQNITNYQTKYKLNPTTNNQPTVYASQIGIQQLNTISTNNKIKPGKEEKD